MLPLWTKSNVYTEYTKHTTQIYTNLGIKIKTLQSNNDTVFLSKNFTDYLNSQGTIQCLTVHNTPQQNSIVEQMHQTILNSVWVNLLCSKLPSNLWVWAVFYQCYIYNWTPKSVINYKTVYYI